jgi:stage II sporulation protein GA (sporulation sigma-E factor processing peptidase)
MWRIFAGGFIGSLIIIIQFLPLHLINIGPLVKLAFSVVMILVAFGFKRFKFFIQNLLMFYFITFLTGGFLIGLHYFIQFDSNLKSDMFLASIKGFGDPISWIFVMFALPAAWYFSKGRVDAIETVKIHYDQLVDVKIEINGVHLNLRGLVASGNNLYDPLTKSPVMIISISEFIEIIPKEVITITETMDDLLSGEWDLSTEWSDRMRFIPAQSVGKKNQLLVAFKPQSIVIENESGQWECKKGLISFERQQLSSDGQFNCIVHPKMMAGQRYQSVS